MARILLIDDDDLVRETIEAMLHYLNHTVVSAPDGSDVVALIRSFDPQLVITDILMPGTEGIETTQVIMRHFPDMPVIAISGATGLYAEYLDVATQFGARVTLQKPFSGEDLRQALETCLATGSGEAP